MATAHPVAAHPAREEAIPVRRIGPGDLAAALLQGWRDFTAIPTQLLFLSVLYPVIGLIAARMASGGRMLPLLWPLVTGFALVGPVTALGLCEISRRRERMLPTSWFHAFDVFRSPALVPILCVTAFLAGVFIAWLIAARIIWNATMGGFEPSSIQDLLDRVLHTPEGWWLVGLGNGVGLLFALLVLATTLITFPVLIDRAIPPERAVALSLRATARNPVMVLLWGLIVAGTLFVASIPAFLGLAIAVPVLGHATWHLYRRLVP